MAIGGDIRHRYVVSCTRYVQLCMICAPISKNPEVIRSPRNLTDLKTGDRAVGRGETSNVTDAFRQCTASRGTGGRGVLLGVNENLAGLLFPGAQCSNT